jgi:hypothetical protein
MAKVKGALSPKPATTLDDLGNQVGKAWLVHQETAFLETAKEDLEAETSRLQEECEVLKGSISRYHDLTDAWKEFSRWAASTRLRCRS